MVETLEIECPVCSQRSKVPASFAGRLGKCPSCMNVIRVPEIDADPIGATGAVDAEAITAGAVDAGAVDAGAVEAGAITARAVDAGTEAIEAKPMLAKPILAKPVEAESVEAGEARPSDPVGSHRPCTFCGESIRVAARKCRYCGEFLDRSLGRKRREQALSDRGWALPLIVPITLALQVPVAVLCAVWVGLGRADGPVFTLGGFMAAFACTWLVTALTPFAAGSRLRVILLCAGNGAGMLTCVATITALNIRPSNSSGALVAVGLGIAIASFAGALLIRRARARQRGG